MMLIMTRRLTDGRIFAVVVVVFVGIALVEDVGAHLHALLLLNWMEAGENVTVHRVHFHLLLTETLEFGKEGGVNEVIIIRHGLLV